MTAADAPGTSAHMRKLALHAWDAQLAKLQAKNPGWHIWYVPCYDGNRFTVKWCAQPKPNVEAPTPETLQEEMTRADEWRCGASNSPFD